jgi:hypothetical protein
MPDPASSYPKTTPPLPDLAGAGKTTTITAKIAYMREKVEKLLQGKEVFVN